MVDIAPLLVRSILSVASAVAGFALGWWALHPWAMALVRTELGQTRLAGRLPTALAAASALGMAAWSEGLSPLLPSTLAFAVVGTTLALVDLAEKRIPNHLLLVGAATVGPLLIVGVVARWGWPALLGCAIGAGAMFALYLLMALIDGRAMGMGDVKLALLVGAMLGPHGLSVWLIGLLATFVLGAGAAFITLVRRRGRPRRGIPFGPFMIAGTLLALAFSRFLVY